MKALCSLNYRQIRFRKGTPYNGLYGDAPPEKASGIERVAGISLAEVYERVWEICHLV